MSSSSSAVMPGYGTISSINFTGGFPDSSDLAPSILFVILYAFSIPVMTWRLASARHRTIILIRPAVFLVCRLAMLIIRAYLAKNPDKASIGLVIAELVLVGVGYLFLLEPLTALWKRLVDMAVPEHPSWVRRIEILLRLSLLASIACIAASGGLTNNAFYSSSGLDTVINLRRASYCLSLGVVGINCIALPLTYFSLSLSTPQTLFLIPPHITLLIVGIYRVAQTFDSNPNSGIRGKAAFWVMEITMEFIAYSFYLSISIPEFFPKTVPTVTEHGETEMKGLSQAERGQAGMAQPPKRRRRGLIGRLIR